MIWFKPNKYNEPRPMPPPPAPTEEKPRKNVVGANEEQRYMEVVIYYNDDDESIQKALGTLEIAKDVVKGKMVEWRARQQRRTRILVPENGKAH